MPYNIVESGALQLAINVLRRADKTEVAAELEAATIRVSDDDGWISVRDKLPNNGENVLVRIPKPLLAGEGYWYDVAHVYHSPAADLTIFDCRYASIHVTHWKPI